jgi:DNA-binding NtrC family response regulator
MSQAKVLIPDLDDLVVGESLAMREVCLLVAKIALSAAAVLIRGEPGVGKAAVARAIHRQSRRAGGPFVYVGCGAIREAELDARLFGQQPDVPAAGLDHPGLLELSDGGTLFLDNVDRLPLWAQVGLCDAFHQDCTRWSARRRSGPLDVRAIASSCCDLETAVAEERFCGELYYLLNVVVVQVPPLRQQDIKILAQRCLAQTLARQGIDTDKRQCRFTREAWQCLLNHPWPGNLPELANVVARAVALANGKEIGSEAIAFAPSKARCPDSSTISVPVTGRLCDIERTVIEEVIQRCRGNKAAAARALGLHRRTLYRMLGEEAHGVGASELCEDRRPLRT